MNFHRNSIMIHHKNAGNIAVRYFIVAALLLAGALGARAQEVPNDNPTPAELWRIAASGGFGWLSYAADFKGLPGVPSCCPDYQDGNGTAIAFGVGGEIRLVPNFFGGVRFLFASYNGTLTADERELVGTSTDTTTAVFRHTIDAKQPAIGTEVTLGYRVLPALSLSAGMRADVMLGGTYHQSEDIVSPSTIRFENDSRQRLVYDGDLPAERRLHMALIAGARYDVPLNPQGSFMLSPEVQLYQGLMDLVDGVSWKMRGIRLGLSLAYINRETPPPPPKAAETEPAKVDTLKPRTPNTGTSSNSDIPNSHP
jgi:hypothetical protein